VRSAGPRPQAIALSPDDGSSSPPAKTSELLVLDPATGECVKQVALPRTTERTAAGQPSGQHPAAGHEGPAQLHGLAFSPGRPAPVSQQCQRFDQGVPVSEDGTIAASHSWPLPPANAPRRKEEIPAGSASARMAAGFMSAEPLEHPCSTRDGHRARDYCSSPTPHWRGDPRPPHHPRAPCPPDPFEVVMHGHRERSLGIPGLCRRSSRSLSWAGRGTLSRGMARWHLRAQLLVEHAFAEDDATVADVKRRAPGSASSLPRGTSRRSCTKSSEWAWPS